MDDLDVGTWLASMLHNSVQVCLIAPSHLGTREVGVWKSEDSQGRGGQGFRVITDERAVLRQGHPTLTGARSIHASSLMSWPSSAYASDISTTENPAVTNTVGT